MPVFGICPLAFSLQLRWEILVSKRSIRGIRFHALKKFYNTEVVSWQKILTFHSKLNEENKTSSINLETVYCRAPKE